MLILGWLVAVPIPLIIIWAPNWWWIVFANLLMGVNQGLAWSMTVTSKMDIVGAHQRGLATGINEFAGYSGVATGALVTGFLAAAYGLRPAPWATVAVSGLGMWMVTAATIGVGMALLYPSLLAAVADNAHPRWRGTSLGVYRMWRDSGYAFGALLIGLISDTFGFKSGFYFTAVVLFVSGAIVALWMYETAPSRRKVTPRWQNHPAFVSG